MYVYICQFGDTFVIIPKPEMQDPTGTERWGEASVNDSLESPQYYLHGDNSSLLYTCNVKHTYT